MKLKCIILGVLLLLCSMVFAIDPWGQPEILTGSMSVMAQVSINSSPASTGDVLAAFVTVGGIPQLRGKESVTVIGGTAGCLLMVYTETNDEVISFKVWDESAQQVYDVSQTLPSVVNGSAGEYPGNLYQIYGGTVTDPWGEPLILTGSMSVMAQVSINSSPAGNGDILAAFVTVGAEEQLRGKCPIQIIQGTAGCLLLVFTESGGETLNFKVWDFSTQTIVPVTQTMLSEVGGMVGSYPNSFYQILAGTPQVVATPSFNPGAGTYQTAQSITISCSTPGAQIRYTTNGIEPTESSALYSSPISLPLNSSTVIKAKAFLANWTPSLVATAAYSITGTVATPVISPPTGTYTSTQSVTISCATAGAQIRYTTNGAEPSASSTLYNAPITIAASGTLKAKAFLANWANSATAVATYNITGSVAMPTFTPQPGEYELQVDVSLACSTDGAAIRYTLDDTEPNEYSLMYTTPIHITQATTIRAKGFKQDWTPSATAVGVYTISVAIPEDPATPVVTGINGIYPNPFSEATNIKLGIGEANQAYQLNIYNIKGECVFRTQGNAKGNIDLSWNGYGSNGAKLPAGVYLVSFCSGNTIQTRKAVLK